MAPQGSWEQQRPLILSKKYYYTSVTLRLNKAPWGNESSKLGAETYAYILQRLCDIMGGCVLPLAKWRPVAWELTPDCQLHCHGIIKTKKKPFRKDVLLKLRSSLDYFKGLNLQIKNYHIYLESLATFKDLDNWRRYCIKTDDKRYLYYDILSYYYKTSKPDRSALADVDIEIDKNGHFKNKETQVSFIY